MALADAIFLHLAGMQAMPDLTRDERTLLVQYVKEGRGSIDAFASYAFYVLPSLVFAVYGMLKADFAAVAVAYVVLLLMVIAGLGYQRRRSMVFRSAVVKCLERLADLERAAEAAVS